MPFYSAFPHYRKGGGQGSGIKHAILRFGSTKLLWIEKRSGGDARIVRGHDEVLGASMLSTLKSSPVVTSDSPRPLDSAVWAARRPGHVSNRRATLTDRRNHG